MNKAMLEKTILEETKGLSFEALDEILDFIQFIKTKKVKNIIKDTIKKTIDDELSELNSGSLIHLEKEFANYKELYPHEA